jgi:RNA polymerase sigma-70 factor, ECF subfamily
VEDDVLLEHMLAGDESAFTSIVNRYHRLIVHVARLYVRTDASAEDVAQETWIAVLKGVERFEGRSTFKTWLLRIATNRARSISAKERRDVPVDPNWSASSELASRFDQVGAWREPPAPFTDAVEDGVVNKPIVHLVRSTIDRLPEPQRSVVTLRDVEGLSTVEVATLLELTEANVRVILHRTRQRIRDEIESIMQVGQR